MCKETVNNSLFIKYSVQGRMWHVSHISHTWYTYISNRSKVLNIYLNEWRNAKHNNYQHNSIVIFWQSNFRQCLHYSVLIGTLNDHTLKKFFKSFFLCGPFLKFLLNLLQYCLFFMFWFFGWEACEILTPQSGIELVTLILEGKVLTTGVSK